MENGRRLDPDEIMDRRGEELIRYLQLTPEEGGPQAPTDDETARPSPFKKIGHNVEPPEAETDGK